MFDPSLVSLSGRLEALGLLGAAFLAFLAIVGLRLMRRGGSRFWAAPGVVALVLLPAVLGAGLTALELHGFLPILAEPGSSGPAARAGAALDSLIPLAVGLLAAVPLALVGLLMIAVGSSKEKTGPAEGGAGGQAVALVAVWLSAALAVFVVRTLAAAIAAEPYAPESNLKVSLFLLASAVLATFLLMLVLFTGLRAPRGSAPAFVKLASLSVVSLCGLVLLVGLWGVQGEFRCYATTVSTGKPCDAATAPVSVAAADAAPTPGLAAVAEVEPASAPRPTAEVEPTPSPEPQPPLPSQPPPPKPRQAPVRATPMAPKQTPRMAERTTTTRTVDAPARKEPPAPVRVGGSIKEPQKIKNVKPVYPRIAIQSKVQGIVIIECTIGPQGDVTRATVLRGFPLLDQAAIDAVRQWVYAPTLVNGAAVPVIMTVTINFRLQPE